MQNALTTVHTALLVITTEVLQNFWLRNRIVGTSSTNCFAVDTKHATREKTKDNGMLVILCIRVNVRHSNHILQVYPKTGILLAI